MHSLVKKYFGLKEAMLLIVGVFAFFAILRFIEVDAAKTFSTLKSTPLIFLLAFIGIRTAGYLLGNYKWQVLVKRIHNADFKTLLPIYFSGYILDNLVPGPGFGAEPIKAHYLGKAIKKDTGSCFATALMDNVLYAAVMSVFLAASAIYMYFFIEIFAIRVAVGILLGFFLIIAVIALYLQARVDHRKGLIERFLHFLYHSRILNFLKKKFATFEHFKKAFHIGLGNMSGAMKLMWSDKPRIFYAVFLSLTAALLGYFGHYTLLTGYGIKVNIYALISAITIIDLIGYYSFIPGGTGVIEGGRITTLSFIGVPAEIAAAITIIDRLAFYIVTYGIGYISLLYVNLKYIGKR